MLYDDAWRARVRSGARASSEVLAQLVVDRFAPKAVVDVGCGEGWLGKALEELGVHTTGVDGPWVHDGAIHVHLEHPPYPELGPYDVATCFEVAEHAPEACADELVAWLTSLAPIVVFSAAVPGQGGEGHVNEQWPGYWAEKFAANGFGGTGALRWSIWNDERVEWWYRQNLLVFASANRVLVNVADGPWADGCPAVVHPGMWAHHKG